MPPLYFPAGIIKCRVNKYSYDNAAIIARRVFQRTAGSVRECKKVLVARLRIVVVIGVWPKGPNEEPGGYLVLWEKTAYEIVETCCEISAYVYTK